MDDNEAAMASLQVHEATSIGWFTSLVLVLVDLGQERGNRQ